MDTRLLGDGQPINFLASAAQPADKDSIPQADSSEEQHSREEAVAHIHELSLLTEVGAVLGGASDVEPVVGAVLSILVKGERLNSAQIFHLNDPGGELRRIGLGGTQSCPPETISLQDPGLAAYAFRQGKPVYIPQAESDARCEKLDGGGRSAYAVPLQTSGRLVGVLEVEANQPDGISLITRKRVDLVATQLAMALARTYDHQQLRASEERFRAMFEQVSCGVAMTDLTGRFSLVNPALVQLLGYTPEELRETHLLDIAQPKDAAQNRAQILSLMEGQIHHGTFESRYVSKTGETVSCSTHLSLLTDAAEKPICVVAMFQDIGERKRGEEEREGLQKQLYQAQKMGALGMLAGGIAHDFNNLLSVMLGFASLARQRLGSGDPLQNSLGMIEESAHRAADLARQLLGFARPERRKERTTSVDEVLNRVQRMMAHTFDRSINVIFNRPSQPLWVDVEPTYLEQALLNICINARDAMPDGGTLTLGATSITIDEPDSPQATSVGPVQYARIAVQDTGTGIAPEALSRVFEPFFTTKEPGHGAGLGLAMVYGFAESHHGFVTAESEFGHGARFTLYLPQAAAPEPYQGPRKIGQVLPGRGTVLVVDDEPLVRAFAAEGLKGLGYDVWVAEDGRQALDIYEQHRGKIDWVLLDLIMPELSGLETYRRMRESDPEVRVVFASGYSSGEILQDAPDVSAAVFIGKPYTLESLSHTLHRAGLDQPRYQ